MLSTRCRPPGSPMPWCTTRCSSDDGVRLAVVLMPGSTHCLDVLDVLDVLPAALARVFTPRCRPPGGAMPLCATYCRGDDRQYPLPQCAPCAAASPAARCHDARPAVVVMTGSTRRQSAGPLQVQCRIPFSPRIFQRKGFSIQFARSNSPNYWRTRAIQPGGPPQARLGSMKKPFQAIRSRKLSCLGSFK